MLIAVFAGFLLSVLVPVVHKLVPRISGMIFALLPAVLFFWFLSFLPRLVPLDGIIFSYNWIPAAWN
jgi:multicomponent Na+:H+ antiporter subunit A